MERPRQKAKRRATLAVLAVLIALCAATPTHAYVYGTQGVGNGGPIVRANLDGSGFRPRFVTQAGSFGIALDAEHLYFTGDADHPGTIGRANLDGTGVERAFVRAGAGRGALAVDGAHVYWTDQIGTTPTIGRANLDGSGVDRAFLALPAAASALAVDGAHLYWGSWHTIGRANLDGSAADPGFVPASALNGLAVGGAHIYWTNLGGRLGSPGTIGRANLDGTGVDQRFITGARSPAGVAVDGTHVYWSNVAGTIGRADLDGSSVDQQFMAVGADDIAVDALGPRPAPVTGVYINCQNRLTATGVPSDALVPLQHPRRCVVFGQPESIATLYPLGDVRWSGWGDATATAKAIWHNPSPREGPPSPIRVKAYRIRLGCAGRRFYTRVAVPGRTRPIVLRLSEACKLPPR
ncbi:MAG TPA: hypothetical protein VKB03_05570 [Conexibacter sp.]|nr:hypothetical protein [Conexibacter sp.]